MVAVLKLISICVCRADSFRKNKEVWGGGGGF